MHHLPQLARKRKVAPVLLLLLVAVLVPLRTRAQRASGIPGWVLKFSEEFEGTSLNYLKWSPHPPARLTLGGIQDWNPDAVSVSGGQAHIAARASKAGYTSGLITTVGNFAQTYGRFEIRFRMPSGRGLEALFRLAPIPVGDAPSIDVMDAVGSEPTKALFANRWEDGKVDRDYTGSHQVADLSSGFHTAAVEWDTEKILWFVDGVERFHSFDGVPHQPMFLVVSLGVNTPSAGPPDAQTRFPAVLDIDYIRVFSRP